MKRWFVVIFILLLFSSLVIAQSNESLGEKNSFSIFEKSNNALNEEVNLPGNLQIIARILFGIDREENVNFQLFVILIAAWIIIFLLLESFVKLMPFFEGWKTWVVSFVIMLLIGSSGGLQYLAGFLIWFSSFFGLLKGLELLGLILSLLALFILYIFLGKLAKILSDKSKIEENEIIGVNINRANEISKIQAESIK